MGYSVFERKIVRTGNPAISISKIGRLGINQHAAKYLRQNAVEYVLLLWDADKRQMAIRPITKKDTRAYTLTYDKKGKGGGAGFFGKSFFDFINYNYGETRSFPASWNENEEILEVPLPADVFKEEGQPKLLTLTAQKKGARQN
jgi:hypothetical protein